MIHDSGCQVVFTWCSSHCDITGNELADALAKEACNPDLSCRLLSRDSQSIRRSTRGGPATHDRTRVYVDVGSKLNRVAEMPC